MNTKEMINKLQNMEWTTREGEKLKIKDMETSHIQNCINLLRKKGCISIKEFKKDPSQDKKKVARFIDIFRIELYLRNRFQIDLLNEFEMDDNIELWRWDRD